MNAPPAYAELQLCTNFSFLEGASQAAELVGTAAALGLTAIAVTDRNTLAGAVRMHSAARELGLRLVVGARLDFSDAPSVLCYPMDRAAYGRLCRLLTLGRRRAPKGACLLHVADLAAAGEGQLILALPPDTVDAAALGEFAAHLARLAVPFGDRLYLAVQHLYRGDDAQRLHRLGDLADRLGIPLVATNEVRYHRPERQRLQDVMTCIRAGCTIHEAGHRLLPNAERHLKPAAAMAELFATRPEAVANTLAIITRCRFSLDELHYEYPEEIVPAGSTPQQELERLAWLGAAEKYPTGMQEKVRAGLMHELELVAQLAYAPYFLTVHDIVRFARSKEILCQGRGSAANSTLCYVLGITAVDPTQSNLLFERFLSAARNEPPDIDVDFEHERREEVIQYIYQKYGRHRAGLAATVITYRPRSALRDVGKALGLSADVVAALTGLFWGGGMEDEVDDARIRLAGLDPTDRTLRLTVALARELLGFPRHLSQHVGGFVLARTRLDELVPIENAAMPDRTIIQWDKDDLEALKLLKVDVLALGMLTCIRKCFDFLAPSGGPRRLEEVPREDAAVYEMLCRADAVGVFQVESRAQMSMLPRLKPVKFYDLVVEVAIVRPGPIQGNMVHPYLRRRDGKEPVEYPSEALREVLEKTFGVPLFQEQAMRIAMVAAGFSALEADKLRRAMASFRHFGEIHLFEEKFITGMVRNGYREDFARRCFDQIKGFGDYGFPESHAASFALLVYVSAWLKRFHPATFCAGLLNSQPMGFYAPAQLVRDAREHGVEVRAVDVNHSAWDCTLEPGKGGPAVRLGLRQVKGFREPDATALAEKRGDQPFRSLREAWHRASLPVAALERLAEADGFRSLGLDRRAALWQVRALGGEPLPLFAAAAARAGDNRPPPEQGEEPEVLLPAAGLGETVLEDYRVTRLSLKAHPLGLLRPRLHSAGIIQAASLAKRSDGGRVSVAGLVLIRQRPATASGIIFLTIEDETGSANIVVWPTLFERYRRTVLAARLVRVTGRLQREGIVVHVVAERLTDLSRLLRDLPGVAPEAMDVAATIPDARSFR